MDVIQKEFDDAMYDFSTGAYDVAVTKLRGILERDPSYFDAQLALGMAHYRQGDYPAAIAAGHAAEKIRPQEQLVHTNLSLFYMKAGDKVKAEHHGLQARIASWRQSPEPSAQPAAPEDPELQLAKPKLESVKFQQTKIPDMPWKKKKTDNPEQTKPPSQ